MGKQVEWQNEFEVEKKSFHYYLKSEIIPLLVIDAKYVLSKH